MPVMSTRKRDDSEGQAKRPRRTGVPLHIYVPPELRDAMDAAADANRRKLTQEVIIALEDHLKKQGRWPPAPHAEKGDD